MGDFQTPVDRDTAMANDKPETLDESIDDVPGPPQHCEKKQVLEPRYWKDIWHPMNSKS
jgi:hypothetical protein